MILKQDTVLGVREDLIMSYISQPADQFPAAGFDLSGNVHEDYLRVSFDLVLSREKQAELTGMRVMESTRGNSCADVVVDLLSKQCRRSGNKSSNQ